MIAGLLKEIIDIYSPYQHKNEYGEVEDSFEKSFRTKAQVVYNSGNRIIDNNEIFNEYKVQFIVRIYHKISELDRIKYDGKFYQIESIEKSRQYQLQKLNCVIVNE